MNLRGVFFGFVWCQSGTRGFFGEGYPFHKFFKCFGLRFRRSTLVAKTTTVDKREGKMPLQDDGLTPKEFIPKCIVVKFWKGVVLNAVSLSGKGLVFLLNTGRWQKLTEPFQLSFMSLEATKEERLAEARKFVEILKPRLKEFAAPVALQLNESCPNHEAWDQKVADFIAEVRERLDILNELGIPLLVKFGLDTPVDVARKIAEHPACDAIVISNTVTFGKFPNRIDWKGLFGSMTSPLMARVGLPGGLSGKPLLQLVIEWLQEAKASGFPKPIAAGGGVLGPKDAERLVDAGADVVLVGSMSILRPWRMQRTINRANSKLRLKMVFNKYFSADAA